MNNKEQPIVEQHYPDLLTGQRDSSLTELVDTLDTLYNAPRRPAYVSWATLKAQADQVNTVQTQTLPRALFRPAHAQLSLRTSIILATVLLALTFGTAYAAVSGLIDQLMNREPGTRYLQQNHQFIDTNMTQATHGVTVTIQKAYSDSNRLIVGYSLQNAKNLKNLWTIEPVSTMYLEQGKNSSQLNPIESKGQRSGNNSITYLESFDVTSIQGNPSLLHLKYVIHSVQLFQSVRPLPVHRIKGQIIPTTHQNIAGPWTFELTVPFHVGQTIMLGQSQTTHGKTFTLDKIIISQSETQIYLHGLTPEDISFRQVSLAISNDAQQYKPSELRYGDATDNIIVVFPYTLINKPGNWTLNLPINRTHDSGQHIIYILTFHFTIPGK